MTEPEAQPDMADAKAKMREALDRKRQAQHTAPARGARNTGAVHGSEVTGAEGKRTYRRKSGM